MTNILSKVDILAARGQLAPLAAIAPEQGAAVSALLDKANHTLESLEDAINTVQRYEHKLDILTWETKEGKTLCRHCAGSQPDHKEGCPAESITILKNPA